MDEKQISEEILEAASKWAGAFNRGDAAGCASSYTETASMHAEPLAKAEGRQEIQSFWQSLVDGGYGEVRYLDPKIKVLSDSAAELSSPWAMNLAGGMIHRELWERQDDGSWLLAEDHFEILEQYSKDA